MSRESPRSRPEEPPIEGAEVKLRGWHIVGEASEAIPRREIPPDKAMEMLDEEVERLGLW
jgi:hypothetical protein